MSNEFIDRYELAKIVIKDVSKVALKYFYDNKSLHISHKKSLQDHVSQADQEVEKIIKNKILEKFSNDNFLGEEFGFSNIKDKSNLWIVDPIDGTSPFIFQIPAWCISIAFYSNGQMLFGLVYDPIHNELFHAFLNKGAYLNDSRIHTSSLSFKEGLIGVGISQRIKPNNFINSLHKILNQGGMFIRNGSGALMLCYVAAGRLVGYYEPHINIWDVAAANIIIQEAGGLTNNFLETDDNFVNGNFILGTANKNIYEEIYSIIK